MKTSNILAAGYVLGQTICVLAAPTLASAQESLELAAPMGVRMETVYLDGRGSLPGRYGPRPGLEVYADEHGRTLYTNENDGEGRSACTGDCTSTWAPFGPHLGGEPVGAWSIIVREDGQRQWALAGKPLYTYVKDEGPDDTKGHDVDGIWKVATQTSHAPNLLPLGFAVMETESHRGESIVRDDQQVLYTFDGDAPGVSHCTGECARTWRPMVAPRLALPIGEFSVAERIDGIKQWAFKEKPLYTYAGDDDPGIARGDGVDGQWHQVLLTRNYVPPSIEIVEHFKHRSIFVTDDGMTLYAREKHFYGPGLHTTRSRLRGNPEDGLELGTESCADECLQKFTPYEAPEDARPWGKWTIVERPDGTRQWAYRHYPLYTYNGDQKPGDTLAYDMYEMTDGSNALFWRVALP